MPESGVKGTNDVAERFYRRIASPMLLDINVDWNGMPVEDIYPRQIPDLFSSGPIIIKGRYSHPGQRTINVHGLLRGKPWSRNINVTFPQVKNDGSAIATLWARERIEDLQSQDWIGAQTGSPKKEITEQIINTALEYRLMSQYTSFVAVEERVVNLGGKTRRLDVPVEMADGVSYEGIFGEKAEGKVLRESLSTGRALTRGRGYGYGGPNGSISAGKPAAPVTLSAAAGATVLSLGVSPAQQPLARANKPAAGGEVLRQHVAGAVPGPQPGQPGGGGVAFGRSDNGAVRKSSDAA
jgi:Ca-activated chloride channel family protein